MKSYQLKTFLAVASTGSFTSAARRVHVSQSTASLHIKDMEEHVGVRLLDRTHDGARPTPAGRLMVTYAHRLLGLEREAVTEVRAKAAMPGGTLFVAASTAPAEGHLPALLGRLARAQPHVEVAVRVGSTEASLAVLRAGECEIAFVGADPSAVDLCVRPFAEDSLILVGRRGCGDPERRGFSWVAREPGSATQALSAKLLPDGVRPTLTVGSTEAVRRCVIEGLGFAFLPRAAVRRDLDDGTLRQVAWPGTPAQRRLYVAIRADGAPSPAAIALWDLATDIDASDGATLPLDGVVSREGGSGGAPPVPRLDASRVPVRP